MSDIYRRFDTEVNSSSPQSQMSRANTPNPSASAQSINRAPSQRATPGQNIHHNHMSKQQNVSSGGRAQGQNTAQHQGNPKTSKAEHQLPDHNKNQNPSMSSSEPKRGKAASPQIGKKRGKGLSSIFQNILPPTVYNPNTKKIFGVFSAEDLLLVALIFLFLDNDEEDNTIMIIALIFVLISDYIDLSDFSF